ncbi:MAG: NfeD family protein [Gammaproteobacteria bacterium]|jgi:membrane protein implicated in regulation of membrane protease activity|nr:NfeD family protein [Gammaproteobacteria bacterium]
MPWWGWIVIGALLLGAELMVIEAEFFLVFIGVSALILGGTVLALPWIPLWAQWLLFAAIALASMVLFRKRVYTALRAKVPGLKDDFVGDELRIPDALAPGEVCRIEIRGSTWQVRNTGTVAIPAGGKARITAVAGIGLQVESAQ